MRCYGKRVPLPYLFDRGMIVIPTSVTVAGANARTCLFKRPPDTEFNRLSTKVMRESANMLVIDWRR